MNVWMRRNGKTERKRKKIGVKQRQRVRKIKKVRVWGINRKRARVRT
jgi:hypothetical protein